MGIMVYGGQAPSYYEDGGDYVQITNIWGEQTQLGQISVNTEDHD
jgi:hypothetical protein